MKTLKVIMALFLGAIFFTSPAWAQSAVGGNELRLLELILTGYYGITLGLGVAAYGLFKISQNDTTSGLILVLVGACLTLAPGIYNGFQLFVCPVTAALGNNIQC